MARGVGNFSRSSVRARIAGDIVRVDRARVCYNKKLHFLNSHRQPCLADANSRAKKPITALPCLTPTAVPSGDKKLTYNGNEFGGPREIAGCACVSRRKPLKPSNAKGSKPWRRKRESTLTSFRVIQKGRSHLTRSSLSL